MWHRNNRNLCKLVSVPAKNFQGCNEGEPRCEEIICVMRSFITYRKIKILVPLIIKVKSSCVDIGRRNLKGKKYLGRENNIEMEFDVVCYVHRIAMCI